MTSTVAPQRVTNTTGSREAVEVMRSLAIRALCRMYLPQRGFFVYRLRKSGDTVVPEGVSRRYTAIVLIGLADEDETVAAEVFQEESAGEVCGRLLDDLHTQGNLGDVALTLWAARALGHERASRACERLRELDPCGQPHSTVELAWALMALSVDSATEGADEDLAARIAKRLIATFRPESGLFPHMPDGAGSSGLRSHVACYADLVYPIQALAHYHLSTGDTRAIEIATACARRMCASQGPNGQWWWHHDIRTGSVVEGYPVYSVHQDSMGPMALFAVQDACGLDSTAAIEKGLRWLIEPAETQQALIDLQADLIWRKVARYEPGKASRGAQALASRIHPALRVPGLGGLLRPGRIDYECRPYHLGWILHAWRENRASRLRGA